MEITELKDFQVTLDIKRNGAYRAAFEMRHNDHNPLIIRLKDDGVDVNLNEYGITQATLLVTRKDKQDIALPGTITPEGYGSFTLGGTSLAREGMVQVVAQFYNEEMVRISTPTLIFNAIRDPAAGEIHLEDKEVTLVELLLSDAPVIMQQAVDATNAANQKIGEMDEAISTTKLNYKGYVENDAELEALSGMEPSDTWRIAVSASNGNRAATARWDGTDWIITDVQDATIVSTLTKQLDETDSKVNEVTRTLMKPYYIEGFATISGGSIGVPVGINNYADKQVKFTVSGSVGDTVLTVLSGNLADAGETKKWAAVIKHDDGRYEAYRVQGANILENTISIYPPLKKPVTAGVLVNLHDSDNGQHYTEEGYFAFAQNIYFSLKKYSAREKYLKRFLSNSPTGEWVKIGLSESWRSAYNTANNLDDATYGVFHSVSQNNLVFIPATVGHGFEWEVNTLASDGYIETFVGGTAKIEFFLDDILVDTEIVNTMVKRYTHSFNKNQKGKIRITGTEVGKTVRIGNTFWWSTDEKSSDKVLDPTKKIVYMGDSWGAFWNKATTREIQRLATSESGELNNVIDHSLGGMTTAWGRGWFKTFILDENPDIAVFEFFTNDFNGQGSTTFIDENGVTKPLNVTFDEYKANIKFFIDECIKNDIQPIIVKPHGTASFSQATNFGNKEHQLYLGTPKTSEDLSVKKLNTESVRAIQKVETNRIEGGESGTFTPLEIITREQNSASRKGFVIKPSTSLTNGDQMQIQDFNGNVIVAVSFDGRVKLKSVQLTEFYQFSLPTPSESLRGRIITTTSNGVDKVMVCVQTSTGVYEWKQIAFI